MAVIVDVFVLDSDMLLVELVADAADVAAPAADVDGPAVENVSIGVLDEIGVAEATVMLFVETGVELAFSSLGFLLDDGPSPLLLEAFG